MSQGQQAPLVPFEQALRTLGDMFGSSWTPQRIEIVLRHEQGSMDQACDRILAHGDKDPQILINEILGGSSGNNSNITAVSDRPRHNHQNDAGDSEGVIWCWKETPSQMYKHEVDNIVGDPCDCWIRYNEYAAQELESAYHLQEGRCTLSGNYRVDFSTMEQTNLGTGHRREVQRLEARDAAAAATAASLENETPVVYNMDGSRVVDASPIDAIAGQEEEPIIVQATAIVEPTASTLPESTPPAVVATVTSIAPVAAAASPRPQVGVGQMNHPPPDIVFARQDFVGDSRQGQLSFPAGAEIVILPGEITNGWRMGKYGNQQGWFPLQLVFSREQQQPKQSSSASSPQPTRKSLIPPPAAGQHVAAQPGATHPQQPTQPPKPRISASDILGLYAASPPPAVGAAGQQQPPMPQFPTGMPPGVVAAPATRPPDNPFDMFPIVNEAPPAASSTNVPQPNVAAPIDNNPFDSFHANSLKSEQYQRQSLAQIVPLRPPQPQVKPTPHLSQKAAIPQHRQPTFQPMQQTMNGFPQNMALPQPNGPSPHFPQRPQGGPPAPNQLMGLTRGAQQPAAASITPQSQMAPQPPPVPIYQQSPMQNPHLHQTQPQGGVMPTTPYFTDPIRQGSHHHVMPPNNPQPQHLKMAPMPHPPQQPPQTVSSNVPKTIPSPAEPNRVVDAKPPSSAESEALAAIAKEIEALSGKKEKMEDHVLSELVTRICCKLDGVEISPSDQVLRSKRKELIKKAESIDSIQSTSTTETPTAEEHAVMKAPDGELPVNNAIEHATNDQPIGSFIPSPQATTQRPSVLSSSDILQLYGTEPPLQHQKLAVPQAVDSPALQPPPTDKAVDLLDLGSSASTTRPCAVVNNNNIMDSRMVAPPPAQAPPVPPMDASLLLENTASIPVATHCQQQAPPTAQTVDLFAVTPTPHHVPTASSLEVHNVVSVDANQSIHHRRRFLAIARFAFSGDASQKQLSFPAGAQIFVSSDGSTYCNNGWMSGRFGDQKGWFPPSYVKFQADQAVPRNEQQQPYINNLSTPFSSSPNAMVSDFETQAPMGGSSNNVHASIATLNHCPWQTEEQVASALAPDTQQVPGKPKRKKKSTTANGGAVPNGKAKPKAKKQTKKTGHPLSRPVEQDDLFNEVEGGKNLLLVNRNTAGSPQFKRKKRPKKKKMTEPAEEGAPESPPEPSQPLNRAPPQYSIPNAERDEYDSDGFSHCFEVMGGGNSDDMFWLRQSPSTEKADKFAPNKKKKKKPKRQPSLEDENQNPAKKQQPKSKALTNNGDTRLPNGPPKGEKLTKNKAAKKKQIAAAEVFDVTTTTQHSGTANFPAASKLKKKQQREKNQMDVSGTQAERSSMARNGGPMSAKFKKKQSKKKIVPQEEVMEVLTTPMTSKKPASTPLSTVKKSRKSMASKQKILRPAEVVNR